MVSDAADVQAVLFGGGALSLLQATLEAAVSEIAYDARVVASEQATIFVQHWRQAEARRGGGTWRDREGEQNTRQVFYTWLQREISMLGGLAEPAIRRLLSRGGAWPVQGAVVNEVRWYVLDTIFDVLHTAVVKLAAKKTLTLQVMRQALADNHLKAHGDSLAKRASWAGARRLSSTTVGPLVNMLKKP